MDQGRVRFPVGPHLQMTKKALKPFPEAISLKKLLGPSFIILALGLGSGEVILWPYLVSNYGLGIFWAAVLGITCQYFMNMEISRYALIKGESIFLGVNKVFKWAPYWFILSTFIGFGLPGIIAASAHVMGSIFGIDDFKFIAIGFLILIGVMLSLSKTVYSLMENVTKFIIVIGVSIIFSLAIILSKQSDWIALAQGLIGIGDGFWLIPAGISFVSFFAAFAYSGAGGNLNLTQSIYVKEKGYGMGKYSQKISGLFTSLKEKETVKLTGEKFEMNTENIKQFKSWWKLMNLEHLFVFWFIGCITMGLLMILSFTTTFGLAGNETGINFVINEGFIISQQISGVLGLVFLLMVSVMLFQTELGVLDSTSRIMAENFAIKKLGKDETGKINLSKVYFIFLWLQIAFGILLFLLDIYEPRSLIVLGAVINAIAMTVHIALVNITNYKILPKKLQANLLRKILLTVIFLIFLSFSTFVVINTLTQLW